MNSEPNSRGAVNVYDCRLDKATLQLAAYSRKAVDSFLNEFDPRPNEHNDRWAVACSLIRYEIDWPLWHDEHRKARTSLLSGSAFFDPWEYSETMGIAQMEPVDFLAAYRGLKQLCGSQADNYFLKAWHSAEVVDYPKPNPLHHAAMLAEYESIRSFRSALPMTEVSFEELLKHSSRAELVHPFREAGESRPRKNDDSVEIIRAAGPESKLGYALRTAPRWKDALLLQAPEGMTWSTFQNFRYLMKAMAGDLATYATGFRLFANRY